MISIIVGYRNRELERVKRSIDSIAAQTYTNFELIFVDYGSEINISKSVKLLIESYIFAKYIYVDTRGMFWNRAHALNIGVSYANSEILVFLDVDLILDLHFLEKISKLSYIDYYYTFSCFYLPENFDYASNIFKNGIHYEQNYVGLCSLRKSSFTSIGGFDEYYMVWGVEDDDLNMRLTTAGIQRNQMNAIEFKIFHQWHIKESPQYPTYWYLEMVQYLSNKKFNNKSIASKLSEKVLLSYRLLLKVRHSIKYDLSIEINPYSGFLVYNELIDGLQDPSIHSFYFCYKGEMNLNKTKTKFTNIYFWRKNTKHDSTIVSKKDVDLFMQFVIGNNRDIIFDYYIEYNQNDLRLYLIKK